MRLSHFLALSALLLTATAFADSSATGASLSPLEIPALHGPARVLRDVDGMAHIEAYDEHDALFLQGWMQAEDRLFQLDTLRRTASGTLAELVGRSALASDVQLRTIGLRRAAVRSLAALSAPTREGLLAYADGVNAWVARHPLPVEYGLLGLTQFQPWTALDSTVIAKGLAFQLSFDLDIAPTLQYLEYQKILNGINPQLGNAVYFLDVVRSAPFASAATVPDANGPPPGPFAPQADPPQANDGSASGTLELEPGVVELLKHYQSQVDEVPFLKQAASRAEQEIGSNEWAVSGAYTRDGRPLVANDPHLSLDLPANFYDLQLVAPRDGLNVIGSSVAGTPWVVLGQNRFVTWGETVTGFDVTDTYREQVVSDPSSPSGLATVYLGALEPIIPVPVTFNVNLRDGVPNHVVAVPPGNGIPPVVLIVPRRNNGPLVQLDVANGLGLSVQYTGFSATHELDSIQLLNHAHNLQEFTAALQYFDAGSQNFIYGDIDGNIAYFSTGEVPLREDLQANTIHGAPPWFIRDGRGGNEWLRLEHPGPTDGTGYQYLPFEELPHVVNPRAGFVVNANNDAAGLTLDNNPVNQLRPGSNGIYYLGYTFNFGMRAARITEMLRQRLAQGRVDREDMKEMQADVTMYDAEVLTPYILRAFDHAGGGGATPALAALAADAGVAEAVARLRQWNHATPTGVPSGYDGMAQNDDAPGSASAARTRNSVAATLYSVWRGQVIANGLDRTLNALGLPLPDSNAAIKAIGHLIERDGVGLSTVDFFAWTGLPSAADRRDLVLLKSLKDSLDLLAGPAFAAAFGGSTQQDDYRWGKLHRHSFNALLGGPFSIPGATPGFPPTFPTLPGLAIDGGFGTVDAGLHDARANSVNGFMFPAGPNRRYVGSPGNAPGSIIGETILPGGMSGVLGDKFYSNLLDRYLRNQTYPLRQDLEDVLEHLDSEQRFLPVRVP